MTSIRLAVCTVCLFAAQAIPLHAGQGSGTPEPDAPNFRILTAGGFLGYLDGLVRADETEGGLLGVERFLASERRPGDMLLITGNNMPHEASAFNDIWGRIRTLQPDAVALSIDDFRRALRHPDGVVTFMKTLPTVHDIPLVASNAVIKAKGKHLNIVSSGGLTLEIAESESIGWLTKVRVAGGSCGESWTLRDLTASAPGPAVKCKPDGGHLQLAFDAPLRPGRHYELALKTTSKGNDALFRFYTHRALIAVDEVSKGHTVPSELAGLPIRYRNMTLAGAGDTQVIIASFVDVETRKRLGADRWHWTAKQETCDGDDCELAFLPPKEALAAITASIGPPGSTGKDPVFVLMSGLLDTPMLSLMSSLPDAPGHDDAPRPIAVPVVLLDPDTSILGRDLGHASVVHGDTSVSGTIDPASTQIWVRPPWVGARADRITGRLAWDKRWQLTRPEATPLHVPGDEAVPRPTPQGTVTYALSPTVTLGPYPSYGVYSGGVMSADQVWQSLAVLVLDVMRRETHADVAVLPKHFIDEDIVGEVAHETKIRPVVFSRFRLGKLLYEQESIVSVDVEGSKLASSLDALVKAQAGTRESVFVAGIDSPGPLSQIDTKHLLINGRAIVPDHFYKVAMPQSVAEDQGLTIVNHDAVPSIVDAIDEQLRNRGGPVLRAADAMTDLEARFARRLRLYVSANPAKFSYFRGTPADSTLLGNIPLAGRSVKAERQWNVSGHGEIALDGVRLAARGLADVRFAKNILVAPPSYPEDEWTAGGRFDVKLRAGAARIFGGAFKQSQFREQRIDDITPARTVEGSVTTTDGEVLSGASVRGQAVHVDNQNAADPDKPAYVFARFGADLSSWNLRPWLVAKDVAAAFDWGKAFNTRKNVLLSGLGEFSISEVYQQGLSTFIAGQFAKQPAAFAVPQVLTFTHKDYEQRRVQIDGTLAVKGQSSWPRWLRDSNLSLTTQIRRYFDEDSRPAFTPNWSIEGKPQLEWTVIHRLKMAPYLNYYRVGVKWPADVARMTKPLDYLKIGIDVNLPIFFSGGPARTFQ